MSPRTRHRESLPNFSVQVQLLQVCNLRCKHCYDVGTPRTAAPATTEVFEWIDQIDALCSQLSAVPALHLSGGEPTLRCDLPEIVDYAQNARGIAVLLFTNGVCWSTDYAKELQRAGLRYVQVSVEGPELVNDLVRGRGTYRAALETVNMLVGLGLHVTVSMTVTAVNYPHIEAFVRTLDSLQLHFHMREVLPLGRGTRCEELSQEQRRALYFWAIGYRGESTVGLEDPIHCSVLPSYAKTRHGCVAGRCHFCVDVDGVIYPCRPLRWAVGHISNLRAAWHSPSMTRLRERRFDGQCGRCRLKEHCGGCRVHALQQGSVFGEDPRCFVESNQLAPLSAEERATALGTTIGSTLGRVLRACRP